MNYTTKWTVYREGARMGQVTKCKVCVTFIRQHLHFGYELHFGMESTDFFNLFLQDGLW